MVIHRIKPLSAAKILGVLNAVIGFCIGAVFSIATFAGAMAGGGPGGAGFGPMFGITAVMLLPIFYGVIGFVATLVAAAVYNLLASAIGGIEIEMR